MKAFRAYATGASVTALTARGAARKFFEQYPTRRKCNVTEGQIDGAFFVVRLSLMARNKLESWKDVTKKTADTLPDVAVCLTGTGAPIAAMEATTS